MNNIKTTNQPWLTPERLKSFLDELRKAGYNVGLSEYLAAQDMLLTVAAQPILEASKFRSLLGPILCTSKFEQENFKDHYNAWLEKIGLFEEEAQKQHKEENKIPQEIAKDIEEIEQESRRVWRLLFLLVIAIIILVINSYALYSITEPVTDDTEFVPLPEANILAVPDQDTERLPPIPEKETTSPFLPFLKKYWQDIGLMTVVVLLIILLQRLRWHRKMDQYLVRLRTADEPDTKRFRLHNISESLFPQQLLLYTARDFRRRKRVPSGYVNVESTIRKYLSQGSWLDDFDYKFQQVQPEYLFLIDRASAADHLATFAREMARQLQNQDVYISIYNFEEDPRLCFPEVGKRTPANLNDLAIKHYNCRLVIFSDATNWFHLRTGMLEVWVKGLEKWPERALLTPKDRARWGRLESAISQHVVVLSSDTEGFKELIKSFDNSKYKEGNLPETYPEDLKLRPRRWLERDAPEPELIDRVLLTLKSYLGDSGYYWLCACAVYPTVQWNITLYLGYNLYTNSEKIFSTDNLKKLGRLPWFRYGYIPDWLRRELITEFKPKQERATREALKNWLELSLENPNILKNPSAVDGIEIAMSEAKLPNSLRQKLVHWHTSDSKQTKLEEHVFKTFVHGKSNTFLAVRLPVQISRILDKRHGSSGVISWLAMFFSFLVLVATLGSDHQTLFSTKSLAPDLSNNLKETTILTLSNLLTGKVITIFEPDRGTGSTYPTNERIRFRIRTNQSGYITVTAIDPDGRIYPLSRNIYVRAGITTIIPTPEMGVEFIAAPPVGLHRVRASFTPRPTNGNIIYRNTHGIEVWTQSIFTEIEPFPEDSRDIVETDLYISTLGLF